jgi:hypothetical protein
MMYKKMQQNRSTTQHNQKQKIPFIGVSILLIGVLLTTSFFAHTKLEDSSNLTPNEAALTPSASYSFPFNTAEWNAAMSEATSELSSTGFLTLVEILIALPPPEILAREHYPSVDSANPPNSSHSFTVCMRTDLNESEEGKIIAILRNNFEFDLRAEDQDGEPYFLWSHYEECSWGGSLRQTSADQLESIDLSVFVRFNSDCVGWDVSYPRHFIWTDAPSLERQQTVIC